VHIDKDLVAASATPLVLAILAEGESYGYAILKRVREVSDGELEWTDGMLYPLLHRLQRLGYVTPSGAPRPRGGDASTTRSPTRGTRHWPSTSGSG
jgi:PadR family transcriptional regulator, regulatory protein PadR